MDALVAHYHEVGLKGGNRALFEGRLAGNLRRALRGSGYRRMHRGFGRIAVDFKPGGLDVEVARRAAHVFGVAYVGAGLRVQPDLGSISKAALDLAQASGFETFAVRARRSRSLLDVRSGVINEIIGEAIARRTRARVDLDGPDATFVVELFGRGGIVYRDRLEGAGGLPVGTSGRMMALLSAGIDSPVAAWRMMRRGAEVEMIHCHGAPFSDRSSLRQVGDIASVLTGYSLRTIVHLVPIGEAQRAIATGAPSGLRTVLYRRLMLRIARELGRDREASALVTGDSLGQVASQTIENLIAIDSAAPDMPVLRPLIGTDKREIIETARAIGTFAISTRPYEDCCSLFSARAPRTRATSAEAAAAEEGFDIDALVGKALADIDTRVFELPPL